MPDEPDPTKTIEERAWEIHLKTLMRLCEKNPYKAKNDGKLLIGNRQIQLDAAKELGKSLKGKRSATLSQANEAAEKTRILDEVDAMASIEEVEEYLQTQLDGGSLSKDEKAFILADATGRLDAQ